MMMEALELQPIDTLFFRDARPMRAGAGSGGHGANWPLPTVVHEALRAALLRQSGLIATGKSEQSWHTTGNGITHRTKHRTFTTRAYESLRTLGPFPVRANTLYFPAPADLVPVEDSRFALLRPLKFSPDQQTNFPVNWLKPVASRARVGKAPRWDWVPADFFAACLRSPENLVVPERSRLFDSEHRIGIGVDPLTRSAKEGALFASEHLRLREGVRLWLSASLSRSDTAFREKQIGISDCLQEVITLGGESRMCRVLRGDYKLLNPPPRPDSTYIKWVLASHAVFRNGWLPNWVEEATGNVLLRFGETERLAEEDRKTWRERVRALPPVNAKLVAACMNKPICFSGWDLALESNKPGEAPKHGGPKPTMVAVPAGSVYYFEADTDLDAAALVTALHGRTRSDFFGEKGMGLGFCGKWDYLD